MSFGGEQMIGRLLRRLWKVFALSVVLTLGFASAAFADEVYNNLDNTIDDGREILTVAVGGTDTVGFKINPTQDAGEGAPLCNFDSGGQLVVKFKSGKPDKATVSSDGTTFGSETTFTFTNCTDTKTLWVKGVAAGTDVHVDLSQRRA